MILDYLNYLYQALSLHPERIVTEVPLAFGILTLALAGIGNAVGQSGTLFLNRLRPAKFITGLGFAALMYSIRFAFWFLLLFMLLNVLNLSLTWLELFSLLALAQAPQIFAYLLFLPCFGALIGFLLNLWTLLISALALSEVGEQGFLWKFALVTLSWILMQLLRRSLAYPLVRAARRAQSEMLETDDFVTVLDSRSLIAHIRQRSKTGQQHP